MVIMDAEVLWSNGFVLRFGSDGVFRAGDFQLLHIAAEWEKGRAVRGSQGGHFWAQQEECDGQKQQGIKHE